MAIKFYSQTEAVILWTDKDSFIRLSLKNGRWNLYKRRYWDDKAILGKVNRTVKPGERFPELDKHFEYTPVWVRLTYQEVIESIKKNLLSEGFDF